MWESAEKIMRAYADMMPREEWQLLLWMVVVSSMYAVLYYLITLVSQR